MNVRPSGVIAVSIDAEVGMQVSSGRDENIFGQWSNLFSREFIDGWVVF